LECQLVADYLNKGYAHGGLCVHRTGSLVRPWPHQLLLALDQKGLGPGLDQPT
jgi:hypothetical protein